MKKLFLLISILSFSIGLKAQCLAPQNLTVLHETETTLTVSWSNSLIVGQVLVNGVPYTDLWGNSSTWTGLGAIVMEKCTIAASCLCQYTAGQGLEITVRNYCTYPPSTVFKSSTISYQLNYPISTCNAVKGKGRK